MRKAGSTTVFDYMLSTIKMYSKYQLANHTPSTVGALGTGIAFDRMEYQAFNIECLRPGAPLADALLITHFRKPIARINSEYWFKGPGSVALHANESLWADWIEATRPLPGGGAKRIKVKGGKFNEGIYYDNYYTRECLLAPRLCLFDFRQLTALCDVCEQAFSLAAAVNVAWERAAGLKLALAQ